MKKNLQLHSPSWLLTLLVSTYLLLMFNGIFFETVAGLHGLDSFGDIIYLISLFVFLLVLINLFISLLAFPFALKPLLIVLLIASSVAAYFMNTYNILIDKTMIQNTIETDVKESMELFSLKLLFFVTATGLLPAALVWRTRVNYGKLPGFVLEKLTITITSAALIGLVAMMFYQDYASLFRNNRHVRDLIVPVNYIHAINGYAKQFFPKNMPVYQTLATDAHLGESWHSADNKRVVSIIVVGETARSANFSLFGYSRETNPKLKVEDVISFSQVASCGTSTAVSLPCMFSNMGRASYDDMTARYTDNLLDVLQRSGLEVVWIDNNSGCKGVCDRVENLTITAEDNPEQCKGGECHDMVLLDKLQQILDSSNRDVVVIMHQVGSHGPAYFLRTPEEFQNFKPFCHTNQLQECSQQEIINAYDNTILYTDHVISSLINYLKSNQDVLDASLLYVSDHGESLGENNLYLHGLPYMVAPDEQTHVPMVLWMADQFATRFSIDKSCLKNMQGTNISHDNLFDSMLGMLDVNTNIYRHEKDIFGACHTGNHVSKLANKNTAMNGETL